MAFSEYAPDLGTLQDEENEGRPLVVVGILVSFAFAALGLEDTKNWPIHVPFLIVAIGLILFAFNRKVIGGIIAGIAAIVAPIVIVLNELGMIPV